MRTTYIMVMAVVAIGSGVGRQAFAGGPNPADYPLRVHVYETKWQKHGSGEVDGEGRANLYENGEPRGFDYVFSCSELFRASMGYETYPAKWRKRNGELEMVVPMMGKRGVENACTLKVVMKKGAYFKHNGLLNEEPAPVFKAWMDKHQYDPERGKNQPTGLAAASPKPN